jgi:hypothetical protein
VCEPGAAAAAPGSLRAALGLPADVSRCASRGVAVALAIALHNVPEGMAVASPIFASTGSARQALAATALSAAAEPLAAIVFGHFFAHLVTPALMSKLNAAVAGVMIALCLGELLPAAASMASTKVRARGADGARGRGILSSRTPINTAHSPRPNTRSPPPPSQPTGGRFQQYRGSGRHVFFAPRDAFHGHALIAPSILLLAPHGHALGLR